MTVQFLQKHADVFISAINEGKISLTEIPDELLKSVEWLTANQQLVTKPLGDDPRYIQTVISVLESTDLVARKNLISNQLHLPSDATVLAGYFEAANRSSYPNSDYALFRELAHCAVQDRGTGFEERQALAVGYLVTRLTPEYSDFLAKDLNRTDRTRFFLAALAITPIHDKPAVERLLKGWQLNSGCVSDFLRECPTISFEQWISYISYADSATSSKDLNALIFSHTPPASFINGVLHTLAIQNTELFHKVSKLVFSEFSGLINTLTWPLEVKQNLKAVSELLAIAKSNNPLKLEWCVGLIYPRHSKSEEIRQLVVAEYGLAAFSLFEDQTLEAISEQQLANYCGAVMAANNRPISSKVFCPVLWDLINGELDRLLSLNKAGLTDRLATFWGPLSDKTGVRLSSVVTPKLSDSLKWALLEFKEVHAIQTLQESMAEGSIYSWFTRTRLKALAHIMGMPLAQLDATLEKLPFYQQEACLRRLAKGVYGEALYLEKSNFLNKCVNEVSSLKGWHDARHEVGPAVYWTAFVCNKKGQVFTGATLKKAAVPMGIGQEFDLLNDKGFSFKTYENICAWGEIEPYSKTGNGANQKSAAVLTKLFGTDSESAISLLEKVRAQQTRQKKKSSVVHDVGLLRLPAGEFDRKHWSGFVCAYPSACSYSQFFSRYEAKLGLPSDLKTFLNGVACMAFENVPQGQEDLAALCFKLKLDQDEFDALVAENYVAKSKANLPDVVLSHEGYTLRLLAPGDKRALLIGIETECCQHANGGAAQSCAVHSYTDASSGVYVVEKGEELVAQSWTWISKASAKTKNVKTVVFDSIESIRKDPKSIEVVGVLFAKLTEVLKQEKSFDVALSSTNYGMTNDVKKWFVKTYSKKAVYQECPQMSSYCSYSDARDQRVLCLSDLIAPELVGPVKADLPEKSRAKPKQYDEAFYHRGVRAEQRLDWLAVWRED